MKQAMRQANREDDVDTMVDSLLADPNRADDIKSMLRQRLAEDGVVPLRSVPKAVSAISDDLDDMWDNVPV